MTAISKVLAVPSGKELAEAGKLTGGIALGIIAGHAAANLVSKVNSPVGHGAMLAVGFVGACKATNPLVKAGLAGLAVYGGLRLAAKATAVVSDPANTQGIAGMIPDSVKESLRKFIPTFAGIEEVAGLGNTDNEFGDLSLDDVGEGTGDFGGSFGDIEQVAGAFGDVRLAA